MDPLENNLRDALREPAPPADLAGKVMARIESAKRRRRYAFLAIAAAALLLIVASLGVFERAVTGTQAVVLETGEKIQDGETVRSAVRATLALADGSRIEMRSNSEMALRTAAEGRLIQLNAGSIIVTAARQHNGHLYVRTKDVTVSVVGTVFLVNAEEQGSRVAVIQGEVQILQGAKEKTLHSGEQVATSSSMPSVPVSEEISWSQNASAHLALLQQNTTPPSEAPNAVPPPLLYFAAVSIKPMPSNPPGQGEKVGFACHGADGTRRAPFGLADPISAPRGRCLGNYVTLPSLIAFAYNTVPQFVAGGPDWMNSLFGRTTIPSKPAAVFQVEAEAEDSSTATTGQLRQMLQTMLADRFKLKFHRDTHEVPGYALLVAKGGPKLKEIADEDSPFVCCLGRPTYKGRSTVEQLAQFLTQLIFIRNGPIVDKTGLAGIYDYEFTLRSTGGGQRGPAGEPRGGGPPSGVDALSDALEDQLGLRLQAQKVSVDVLVIDEAEKPSEN